MRDPLGRPSAPRFMLVREAVESAEAFARKCPASGHDQLARLASRDLQAWTDSIVAVFLVLCSDYEIRKGLEGNLKGHLKDQEEFLLSRPPLQKAYESFWVSANLEQILDRSLRKMRKVPNVAMIRDAVGPWLISRMHPVSTTAPTAYDEAAISAAVCQAFPLWDEAFAEGMSESEESFLPAWLNFRNVAIVTSVVVFKYLVFLYNK